jgi:hypothetical protein
MEFIPQHHLKPYSLLNYPELYSSLDRDGYLFLPDLIFPCWLKSYNHLSFTSSIHRLLQSNSTFSSSSLTYNQFISGSFIDIRGDNHVDIGMTDISNPFDSRNPDLNTILEQANLKNPYTELRKTFDLFFLQHNLFYSHSNLYLYSNVFNPRAFHVDSSKPHFKVFLNLLPLNNTDGPYSFCPHSHKSRLRRPLSRLLAFAGSYLFPYIHDNDMLFFSSTSYVNFIAMPGDVIVTNQSGAHGDAIPSFRSAGVYKSSIVLNYTMKKRP